MIKEALDKYFKSRFRAVILTVLNITAAVVMLIAPDILEDSMIRIMGFYWFLHTIDQNIEPLICSEDKQPKTKD